MPAEEHDPWNVIAPYEPTWLNPRARRWFVLNDRFGIDRGSGVRPDGSPLSGGAVGTPTSAANPMSPATGGFDFGDLSFLFGLPKSQQQNGMGELFNLLLSLGLSQSGNGDPMSGLFSGIEV